MTPQPLHLVIFDCDGVLVDSEALSNRVCAEEITRLGWPMTEAEAMARFVVLRPYLGRACLSRVPLATPASRSEPRSAGWRATARVDSSAWRVPSAATPARAACPPISSR